MISLPNNHPIIKEAPMTMYTINSIPIINTKNCTLTASSPWLSPLPIWTSDIIIFFFAMKFQQSEVKDKTCHFSDRLGSKFHNIYLNSGLLCAIIFTATKSIDGNYPLSFTTMLGKITLTYFWGNLALFYCAKFPLKLVKLLPFLPLYGALFYYKNYH